MTHHAVDCDVTHDATTDSTFGYELTGRHLQVAAILGHVPHGGRVRLTVTQLGQIGELVAWGELQGCGSDPLSAPRTAGTGGSDLPVRRATSGLTGALKGSAWADVAARRVCGSPSTPPTTQT